MERTEALAAAMVDAAIAVHRVLGPGLLESAYVAALQIECSERGFESVREAALEATYRGRPLGIAYRADLLVENALIVEVKSVRSIDDVHLAQVLSYLRMARLRLALLLNFNVALMKHGIRRVINTP